MNFSTLCQKNGHWAQCAQADLLEQLAIREQQLEQLRQAYVQLQTNNTSTAQQGRLFKTISHLATFTGTGDISINSFFSSVEYLLSSIQDPELKRPFSIGRFKDKQRM